MGRHSKLLPRRLHELAEQAAQDTELTSLRAEVELLDIRLCDLLRRVDSGESESLWRDLQGAYRMLEMARDKADKDGMARHWGQIGSLIKRGAADCAIWAEINGVIEAKRKTSESIHRNESQSRTMISAEQVLVLAKAVTEVFRAAVTANLDIDDPIAEAILIQTSEAIGELLPPS